MTTLKEIAGWFEDGRGSAAYMIVVCDTFDYDDYPVYVKDDQDFWVEYDRLNGHNMQKVMEVYDYSIPWSKQSMVHAMNTPVRPVKGETL